MQRPWGRSKAAGLGNTQEVEQGGRGEQEGQGDEGDLVGCDENFGFYSGVEALGRHCCGFFMRIYNSFIDL